jgi:hypothetical protein
MRINVYQSGYTQIGSAVGIFSIFCHHFDRTIVRFFAERHRTTALSRLGKYEDKPQDFSPGN